MSETYLSLGVIEDDSLLVLVGQTPSLTQFLEMGNGQETLIWSNVPHDLQRAVFLRNSQHFLTQQEDGKLTLNSYVHNSSHFESVFEEQVVLGSGWSYTVSQPFENWVCAYEHSGSSFRVFELKLGSFLKIRNIKTYTE